MYFRPAKFSSGDVLLQGSATLSRQLAGLIIMSNINPFIPIGLISPIRNFCLLLVACPCQIILIIKYFPPTNLATQKMLLKFRKC